MILLLISFQILLAMVLWSMWMSNFNGSNFNACIMEYIRQWPSDDTFSILHPISYKRRPILLQGTTGAKKKLKACDGVGEKNVLDLSSS